MRCVFATCPELPGGREDDRQVAARIGARFAVWSDPEVDWDAFDRVVIRSTWDYTLHVDAFLRWTRRVGPDRLRNAPELVAWNADKRYMTDLSVPTVPTVLVGPGDPMVTLAGEVVVKPNVSAGARSTGRFPPARHEEAVALIEEIRGSGRTALVQTYLPAVEREGETAIVFLRGELSHVLRKGVVLRDPGVAPLATGAGVRQVAAVMLEDDLVAAGEADADERALAAGVMREIAGRFGMPLYARVDMIRDAGGAPVLLELEVVEPCLYLELSDGAVDRFAAAITGH